MYICNICHILLLFISTGESFSSIQYLYHVPAQTFGKIVIEMCIAISEVLEDYIKVNHG